VKGLDKKRIKVDKYREKYFKEAQKNGVVENYVESVEKRL